MKLILIAFLVMGMSLTAAAVPDSSYIFISRDFYHSKKAVPTSPVSNNSSKEYKISGQKIPLVKEASDTSQPDRLLSSYLKKKKTANILRIQDRTTLAEVEEFLSKVAGNDQGFIMVTTTKWILHNPQSELILEAVREWENARLGGAFSVDQKTKLKENKHPYHLNKVRANQWDFYQLSEGPSFEYNPKHYPNDSVEPAHWIYELKTVTQYIQFKLAVEGKDGASCKNPSFSIGHSRLMVFTGEIKKGEVMIMDGTMTAHIFKENGEFLRNIRSNIEIPALAPGKHMVDFQCKSLTEGATVRITMVDIGFPVRISLPITKQ